MDEQLDNNEAVEAVENFAQRYFEKLQDLPAEYAKIVSDNLWDLV